MTILITGLLHAQYGTMTKSYDRKDTMCILSPEDFYPHSIVFVDQKITEGGHTDHIRYVDMGDGNTIAWPEELTVKNAYALLNNDSSAVLVTQNTYVHTGIMDFILFWKTSYQRTNYLYSLEWQDEGPPSFSEPQQVGEPKIIRIFERKKRLIFFFICVAFGIGIFVGRQHKQLLKGLKDTPIISWPTLVMLLILPAAPFLISDWYNGLIESIPLTTVGLLGILLGTIYSKKKVEPEVKENTNDSRLPNEFNM